MWLKYNSQKKRLIVEIIGKGGDDKEEEVWGNACYHQVTTTLMPHCALSFRGNSCSEASKLLLTASTAQTTLHSTELPRSQTGWQNTQRGALKRTLYCRSCKRSVVVFLRGVWCSGWEVAWRGWRRCMQWDLTTCLVLSVVGEGTVTTLQTYFATTITTYCNWIRLRAAQSAGAEEI